MSIKNQNKQLDKQIQKGRFIEAAEEFFADDIITKGYGSTKTVGKEAKLTALRSFFEQVEKIKSKLTEHATNDNTTYSSFVFDISLKNGDNVRMKEVIERQWANNLVVAEIYRIDVPKAEDVQEEKNSETKKTTEVAAAPTTAPTAVQQQEVKSATAEEAVVVPAKARRGRPSKSAANTTVKPPRAKTLKPTGTKLRGRPRTQKAAAETTATATEVSAEATPTTPTKKTPTTKQPRTVKPAAKTATPKKTSSANPKRTTTAKTSTAATKAASTNDQPTEKRRAGRPKKNPTGTL